MTLFVKEIEHIVTFEAAKYNIFFPIFINTTNICSLKGAIHYVIITRLQ